MNTTQAICKHGRKPVHDSPICWKNWSKRTLTRKLMNTKNSAGFLIRHVGDVELLFAKNVFGATDVHVQAKTIIAQHDTGEWTNLQEFTHLSARSLQSTQSHYRKTNGRWLEANHQPPKSLAQSPKRRPSVESFHTQPIMLVSGAHA